MLKSPIKVWVPGPVIVGAGPSGLATAACLKERSIPSLILERDDCIASLWQKKTYNRLRLHLPKQFCELPLMPFPSNFQTYPTKQEFVTYLEEYAKHFNLEPIFNKTVVAAEFDAQCGFWRVTAVGSEEEKSIEYVCQWLIVATGENAEEVVPMFEGMDEFDGPIIHTSAYKSGDIFSGKAVLVVGCGNSGMEVHILPLEMLGRSTFGLSMWLLKWLPVQLVDHFLLFLSNFVLGNTDQLGLNRPKLGPLQHKCKTGKTPVLDVGTLDKIRTGKIKVFPGINRLMCHAVEFVNGTVENFDAIILATGYRSNVPSWLKGTNLFSHKNGLPEEAVSNGWKGNHGLYAVGFTGQGLLGTSMDATRIAVDIEIQWNVKANQLRTFANSP
ncbi:hypothetical protein K7X08_035730 [Anisodus acutangulus]|uniref:Flavin-containing monooxygenase n=1 Tax=Anisodus acutangulus TaxID=402998 RepID=A0A9Q1ME13_9SOLA|nr:hypothetical protein K7X08_035730 [Anisodus acutangulus]